MCYEQAMDMDNPWITLLKAWICTCAENLWIACSIRRLRKMKGTEHGFRQSSNTDINHPTACLSEEELQA